MAELSAPLRRRPPHLPVPPRTLGGEGGHLQDGQNRAGATNLHFKRDTPKEKLQPAQPHGAAALLHWQRERHTGYDCRPREPGQHAQDAGVRPSPPHCPAWHSRCSSREVPFSTPRDHSWFCLLYPVLGSLVNLVNLIFCQDPVLHQRYTW